MYFERLKRAGDVSLAIDDLLLRYEKSREKTCKKLFLLKVGRPATFYQKVTVVLKRPVLCAGYQEPVLAFLRLKVGNNKPKNKPPKRVPAPIRNHF